MYIVDAYLDTLNLNMHEKDILKTFKKKCEGRFLINKLLSRILPYSEISNKKTLTNRINLLKSHFTPIK